MQGQFEPSLGKLHISQETLLPSFSNVQYSQDHFGLALEPLPPALLLLPAAFEKLADELNVPLVEGKPVPGGKETKIS